VDVAQRTKKMFNVTGIPHIIFFVDGRVVRKITGSNSEALINAVTSL
jgi:thioredoxin-like negative regulator of GroEL